MVTNSTELFEGNLHLAKKIAWKMMRSKKVGMEFDDLHQEALIALNKAAKIYDADSHISFERFAVSVMYNETLRWMMYKQNLLRTSKDVIELAVTINKRKIAEQPAEEIATELNAKQSRVELALQHLKRPFAKSIYEPIPGAESLYLFDTLKDNNDAYNVTALDFKFFIEKLEPEMKRVVELRVEGMSQQEIGDIIGSSQMHVSRLIRKIKEQYIDYTRIS